MKLIEKNSVILPREPRQQKLSYLRLRNDIQGGCRVEPEVLLVFVFKSRIIVKLAAKEKR